MLCCLHGCREPQSIIREKTKEGKKEGFGLVHSEGGRRKPEREKVHLTIIHQDLGSIVRVICFSFSQTF